MQSLNVVVASHDTRAASQLATSLNRHFRSVSVAGSLDEVRHAIPRHRAQLAILDLELASLQDVEQLAREFNCTTSIVCTHRIPDEEMWTAALSAGAIDCCPSDDAACILNAVDRYVTVARATAA